MNDAAFEFERYELTEPARYHFDPDRRELFKLLGGGLVVWCVPDAPQDRRRGFGREGPREIGAWLHVGEDGAVTVNSGKVEIGQDIRTSLAQAVAEELRVPLGSIRMVLADTKLTPFDMGTFGSQTTPSMSRQLRRAAAAAREALVDLAAESLKVDRATLSAADGKIVHAGSGRSLGFGELTRGQKLARPIPENVPTTPADRWQVAGRSVPKVGGREIVTGRHVYASDVRLPGMLHARVLRPPTIGATLVSVDTSAAESMAGVVVVHDGDFVGVAAPTEREAERARNALKPDWKDGPAVSGKDLFEQLLKGGGGGGRGGGADRAGSLEEGRAAAEIKLEATYTVAYIAHAPLEPRAAVAQWEEDRLTVWTGTQRPFGVRGELAGALRIPEDKIRVIVPDMGSGYGGKHTGEAAIEAARLARAAGKPVKLVWTREEEFTHAYFRPAGVLQVRSGARKDGTLTAWEFHNYNSGGSSIRTPYEVAHRLVESHGSRSPLRQGSYRALAATANTFARESHMDELAQAAGIDPLEFRLKNLKDARLRAVLEAAAKAFGWGARPGPDRGFGIAAGTEKGSFVATCAEVVVERPARRVRVARLLSAFECGAVLNPDHLKNQVEGSMVMGLGGALTESIDFEAGKILNPRFSAYKVPRFEDMPVIEVVLVDRKDLPPAGAGETPIIAVAPAVAGAIFAAAGVRLRSLPMVPDGVLR